MKLNSVTIHKYKCIETEQSFEIENDITVLVGMNESGKTSALEAIAKTNYFQKDEKFVFNTTHDYPRKEKKKLDKSGEDPKAITCIYTISEKLKKEIAEDIGEEVLQFDTFTYSTKFSNQNSFEGVKADLAKFIDIKTKALGIGSKTLNDKLLQIKNSIGLDALIKEYTDEVYTKGIATLKIYFENKWKWTSGVLNEYIARVYLTPNIPKFLYYDEYYSLPSRINIEQLQKDNLLDEDLKTAKALFELADINVDELLIQTITKTLRQNLKQHKLQ